MLGQAIHRMHFIPRFKQPLYNMRAEQILRRQSLESYAWRKCLL